MSNVSSQRVKPPPTKADKSKLARLMTVFLSKGRRLVARHKLPLIARRACRLYLDDQDATVQQQCRQVLKSSWQLNPKQLKKFLNTTIGKALLDWVKQFFRWSQQQDPHQTLAQLILQMAADPDGLSLLSASRHYPEVLKFNPDYLLFTVKRMEWLLKTTRMLVVEVASLAAAEATQSPQPFSQLPDFRRSGKFAVHRRMMTLEGRKVAHGSQAPSHPLEVRCFAPSPWPDQPVPLIVQSHGLASTLADIQLYAAHLASHGYCVMLPRHPGSDVHQIRRLLQGDANEVFEQSEFLDRPADISYLLDVLSQGTDPVWRNRLNLEQVGIIGHSFGAYTALALAGARIHFEGLEKVCGLPDQDPNPSLLLQCQALTLPRQPYQLQDHRVKAVLLLDAVGSEIFGAQGLGPIHVPVMLVAGSHDMTAPLVLEQMRIFRRLPTERSYFALIHGKSHLRSMHEFMQSLELDRESSWETQPEPTSEPLEEVTETVGNPIEQTIQALSVAFFEAYLSSESTPSAYLTAAYGQYLSQSPHECWLISDRSRPALEKQLQIMDEEYLAV
ncbi:MAG: alpha/beta hydrolase [Leptolyngbya sp. SIOISBB]|nr:alpha/beta hydrolase [Leptolyngbya sp. SIOISBB]